MEKEKFKYKKMLKTFLATAAVGTVVLSCLTRPNVQNLERELITPTHSPTITEPTPTNPIQLESVPTNPIHEEPSQREINPLLAYAEYTGNFEGRKPKVYDPNPNDGKPEPTIGVGHYLDRGDSEETFARVLPELDYDEICNGNQELTETQINKLFSEDIKDYVARAKSFFPKFDTYPEYLQKALVDGFYRGDLGDSPKTRALINSGNFEEAADEYIDRKDYRNAIENGMRGVKTRMDANRDAMIQYAIEISGSKE
jgi:hypothetical protein